MYGFIVDNTWAYIILFYILSYYITLFSVVLCYVMLWYVMLFFYDILFFLHSNLTVLVLLCSIVEYDTALLSWILMKSGPEAQSQPWFRNCLPDFLASRSGSSSSSSRSSSSSGSGSGSGRVRNL